MTKKKANYRNITKARVKSRMNQYLNLTWTYNSKKNADLSKVGNRNKVTQPKWLESYSDGKNHRLKNVPYCWGGWNAESFINRINAGDYAGNIQCDRATGWVSGTVGMDCSGFVSVAFDLPSKHGTGTLGQCFTARVNKNDVHAYDILNRVGYHVMIVSRVYMQNGQKYVDTYEETTTAGKILHTTGKKYQTLLQQGYIPMSYDKLS